ncbi:MAG: LPS-assembly protein LptD [Methylophilaceae bacterium]|nr:LPS-assembly protein LptD [Methylophilaceae bacterium]
MPPACYFDLKLLFRVAVCLSFLWSKVSWAMGTESALKLHFETTLQAIHTSEKSPPSPITLLGDTLEFQLARSIRLIGNAELHHEQKSIHGDILQYQVVSDSLRVDGHVEIKSDKVLVRGHSLRLKLSEEIGEMPNAFIEIHNAPAPVDSLSALLTPNKKNRPAYSRSEAAVLYFEGADKRRLKKTSYTTCEVGVNDWYIKADELELNDVSESGTARHATVEFKGVPLLYTPWLQFAYNNQRKSGLLTPIFGSTSKSGLELVVPFYWNIAPNMDATLGVRELSKRGNQLQTEFRYLQPDYSGSAALEYLNNDNQLGKTRFYANLRHQQDLGHGWSANYAVERVSDKQYFAELSTRITATSRVNLPQQVSLHYTDDVWRLDLLAQQYQTLDGVSYPYQRLPQLNLRGYQFWGGLETSLNTQVVRFDADPKASNLITGTRFIVNPTVAIPLQADYGYMTPKLSLHHTSYWLDKTTGSVDNQINRTLPIVSLDSGVYFDRRLAIGGQEHVQTLEPRLFYVYIPNTEQGAIPVFDSGFADLNFSSLFRENQFTGGDRVNNANQLSLAMTTRFIQSASGMERFSASIGQRYYFADQVTSLPNGVVSKSTSSDIIAGLSSKLDTHWNADLFLQYNTDNARLVHTTITSRYRPELGKVFNISYSYRQDLLSQIDVAAQQALGNGWYGIGRVNYSFIAQKMIESLLGIEYNAGCWQARTVIQRVNTATADANYALFFQLELGGLASIGSNPLSVIQRNVQGYTSSGLLSNQQDQSFY